MHETGKKESYDPGHLTFDCPWCGAISGVQPELIGEHFECVECGKETKLTDQNTRHAHLFEPPSDAPHLDDSPRPFTCPWCGDHAEIPPTHLGEYYDCKECHKRTKLTPRTLPSPEEVAGQAKSKEEHHAVWPLGLAAVIVVGAVLWALFGRGGNDESPKDGDRSTAVVDSSDQGNPAGSTDAAATPTTSEPTSPGGTGDATDTDADTDTSPADPGDADERTSIAYKVAKARLEKATAARTEAQEAVTAWLAAHPDVAAQLELQSVRESLLARAQELLESMGADATGPAQARAFNQKFTAYVEQDPSRVALAEALLADLTSQPIRPVRVRSWQQLNFHQPRLHEVLEDQIRAGRAAMPNELLALTSALMSATASEEDATAEFEAASAK